MPLKRLLVNYLQTAYLNNLKSITMEITVISRKFKFISKDAEIELNDIQGLQPEEIKNVYAGTYPELTNGKIEYKGIINNEEVYEFRTIIGTKG